jgi:predicted nucleotidyltransferase component of viral defense system
LSRIIVDIFSNPFLNQELAFRGGTALHKLFFSPAARYSEDIDLVRTSNGPITKIADTLRKVLEPWLLKPKIIRTARSFKMIFYFNPENSPSIKLRIKIEINIEESFSVLDRFSKKFSVQSDWFSGFAEVNTFHFNELIATKLRALYQRSKGRDVFDLWLALKHDDFNIPESIRVFLEYMTKSEIIVTREIFERNIELKLRDDSFLDDIGPLLSPDLQRKYSKILVTELGNALTTEAGNRLTTEGWNLADAAEDIKTKILAHLPK